MCRRRWHRLQVPRRAAKDGTLILGGGFGGAHVARLLGSAGATIVDPGGAMLFTPLLPEVAAGAVEPRRALVPLRMMCPDAELVRGRAVELDEAARTVAVQTELGLVEIGYERLVIALGSTARVLPIPGLAEHALVFKELGDAIALRNHILRRLELAEADPANGARHLCFVFVGAGYAGVEALAEMRQLVQDAMRHYPGVRAPSATVGPGRGRTRDPGRGPRGARELHGFLPAATRGGDPAARPRSGPSTQSRSPSHGRRIETETVVWTAGVTPRPVAQALGLPVDERGRILVDPALRVQGRTDIWALGDNARVPNAATPLRPDPPTCQHAVRQARAVVRSLGGDFTPYRYRSIGEGATLGRGRGVARVFGLHLRGRLGGLVTRAYHVRVVPSGSRRVRIVADGVLSVVLRRDIVELGSLESRRVRS